MAAQDRGRAHGPAGDRCPQHGPRRLSLRRRLIAGHAHLAPPLRVAGSAGRGGRRVRVALDSMERARNVGGRRWVGAVLQAVAWRPDGLRRGGAVGVHERRPWSRRRVDGVSGRIDTRVAWRPREHDGQRARHAARRIPGDAGMPVHAADSAVPRGGPFIAAAAFGARRVGGAWRAALLRAWNHAGARPRAAALDRGAADVPGARLLPDPCRRRGNRRRGACGFPRRVGSHCLGARGNGARGSNRRGACHWSGVARRATRTCRSRAAGIAGHARSASRGLPTSRARSRCCPRFRLA